MALFKGAQFSSFEAFEATMTSFCFENNCLFTKRSSEKIKDASLNHLMYEHIVFGCKQGVKRHESTITGARPQQRSLKVGCAAKLRLKVVRLKDKSRPPYLSLTVCDLEHSGHEVNKNVCQLYPENRRVVLDEASKLLASSTTIKASELKTMLEQRHKKPLLTHDVYNIKQSVKQSESDGTLCESIVSKIRDGGGCVDVCMSDSGEFKYFVYQTFEMKQFFSLYPDVVVFDATYKTNVYLYPLLTAMVIDSEGRGIPVMHAFLCKEDQESIEHCLRLFSQQNCFANTKCFVVDKDMAEISALEAVFPGVPVHLCCFHISQAVKRFLRKELPSGSVDTVHDLFMQQVYTESGEEYLELQTKISEMVPESVSNYFMVHWWQKADMWAASRHCHILKLHATTTNHLESYHNKIKATINEKLTLSKTLELLLTFDADKMSSFKRQHLIEANSVRVDQRDGDVVSREMTRCMTRFAAAHVKNQLTCARKTPYNLTVRDNTSIYIVTYKEKSYDTTIDSCSCSFFNQMSRLPCRHIFAVRSHLGQELFSASMVPERFLLSSVPHDVAILPNRGAVLVVEDAPFSYASQEGRYRKIKGFCDSLIASMTVLGQREFTEKISQLENLIDLWNQRDTDNDLLRTNTDNLPEDNDNRPAEGDNLPEDDDNNRPADADNLLPTDTDNTLVVIDNYRPADPDNLLPTDTDNTPVVTDNNRPADPDNLLPTDSDNTPVHDNNSPSDNLLATESGNVWPKMNRILKPRGRPSKKQNFTRASSKRRRKVPVKFSDLSEGAQQQLLISSVFDCSTNTLSSQSPVQFHITDLRRYTDFKDLIMDRTINLDIIKPLMDSATWDTLIDGIETRRGDQIFKCGGCREIDDGEHKMILCEQCLSWFHYHCAGYRSNMKIKTWFCNPCMCGETL